MACSPWNSLGGKFAAMRRALLLVAMLGCREEEKEEFGLDPPAQGAQIHIGRQTIDPDTAVTRCEERILGSDAALLSDAGAGGDAGTGGGGPLRVVGLELLATPALQTLEVYALDEASGEPAQDCPLLPAAVMGDLSEPIRMVYYADVSGAAMKATDQFAYPGGAAIPLAAEQPLLLRYSIQTGAEPEDLEVFLNLTSVASAAVVAQPFTFSYE